MNSSDYLQPCDNVPDGLETCAYQWAMIVELLVGLCTIILNVVHIYILQTNYEIQRRAATRVTLHLAACDLIYGEKRLSLLHHLVFGMFISTLKRQSQIIRSRYCYNYFLIYLQVYIWSLSLIAL